MLATEAAVNEINNVNGNGVPNDLNQQPERSNSVASQRYAACLSHGGGGYVGISGGHSNLGGSSDTFM
jgi:hypothetical protein